MIPVAARKPRGGVLESLQALDIAAFAARHGGVTVATFKAGTLLYSQGQPADALFQVQEGRVQITVVSSQGKEGILRFVDRGDYCGEGCLLDDRARVTMAVCSVDSVVARLERANVIRAIREDPAVAEFFVVHALTHVVRMRDDLISQLIYSSEQRLARILLVLANSRNESGQDNVIRDVDQEALAHMIGTTRSRVNYFMNKFRKLGCIDYDGSIIVVHPSLSQFVSRDDPFDACGLQPSLET